MLLGVKAQLYSGYFLSINLTLKLYVKLIIVFSSLAPVLQFIGQDHTSFSEQAAEPGSGPGSRTSNKNNRILSAFCAWVTPGHIFKCFQNLFAYMGEIENHQKGDVSLERTFLNIGLNTWRTKLKTSVHVYASYTASIYSGVLLKGPQMYGTLPLVIGFMEEVLWTIYEVSLVLITVLSLMSRGLEKVLDFICLPYKKQGIWTRYSQIPYYFSNSMSQRMAYF